MTEDEMVGWHHRLNAREQYLLLKTSEPMQYKSETVQFKPALFKGQMHFIWGNYKTRNTSENIT